MSNSRARKLLVFKLIAIGLALGIGLIVAEVAIRIIRPDLAELASSSYQADAYRIYSNPVSHREEIQHPDTGKKHLVITNSLGLRQHREFDRTKPDGVFRIGVFGDSFTENIRMPVAYSFTEPLQYLFERAGHNVEVLNFGTDGYGTDQMLLQYLNDGVPLGLDMVVYICCHNDPLDIYANRLYQIDESGTLNYVPERKKRPWVGLVRKFALTYLIIQATARQPEIGEAYGRNAKQDKSEAKEREQSIHKSGVREFGQTDRGKESLRLFGAVLDEWENEAKDRDQDFVVALLPRRKALRDGVRNAIVEQGAPLIDLAEIVSAEREDLAPLTFKNDAHWNEEGNKYGAVHLFKALAKRAEFEYGGDAFIHSTLSEYYGAFGREPIGDEWLDPAAAEPISDFAAKLKWKYLELESKDGGWN